MSEWTYNAAFAVQDAKTERDKLIAENIRLVPYMLKRMYRDEHIPDDAMQVGMMALIGAADKFDESRGVKFSTYACVSIKQSVWRWKTARREQPLPSMGDADSRVAITDDLASDEADASERKASLAEAMSYMSEREQLVLRLRFFDSKLLTEVASQLGVTKERVRQLESRALRKASALLERLPQIRKERRAKEDADRKIAKASNAKSPKLTRREQRRANSYIQVKRWKAEGRCYICCKTLPNRQFKKCQKCRAKYSFKRRLKRSADRRRRSSRHDAFLAAIGYDTSLIRPAAVGASECLHERIVRHGKAWNGEQRYRCKECGRTWLEFYAPLSQIGLQ